MDSPFAALALEEEENTGYSAAAVAAAPVEAVVAMPVGAAAEVAAVGVVAVEVADVADNRLIARSNAVAPVDFPHFDL